MSIAQKKHLGLTLQRAITAGAKTETQLQGQGLPCSVVSVSGAIVTVAFEVTSNFTLPQVTCPIAESFYVRLPIQAGDKGYVSSASARLGGISGLGEGLAPLVTPANLGGLVFVPIGNSEWATIDPNAVVINAPNGAVLRTIDGACVVTINDSSITLQRGGKTVVVDDSGITMTAPQSTVNGNLKVNGNVVVTGDVSSATMTCSGLGSFGSLTIGGHPYLNHEHQAGTYHASSTTVTGTSGTVV